MIYEFDNLTFQVLETGRFFHKKGIIDVKPRKFAALSFRVNGFATIEIDEKTIDSKEGEILYIPADTAYKADYSGGESIVAHLTDCNYKKAESFTPRNPAEIKRLFEKMLSSRRENCSVNKTKSQIYDILDKVQREGAIAEITPLLAACLSFIERRAFDSELTIEDVAKKCFTSVSTLQREFKKTLKTSPKCYLNDLRMKKAAEMLAENKESVKNVAEACGFDDEKYFSRKFRKQFGCPPTHYRVL